MEKFGNSEVIPCHYVTFTLFSIIATSIVYQARVLLVVLCTLRATARACESKRGW